MIVPPRYVVHELLAYCGVLNSQLTGPSYALSVVRYDAIINHSKSISLGGGRGLPRPWPCWAFESNIEKKKRILYGKKKISNWII